MRLCYKTKKYKKKSYCLKYISAAWKMNQHNFINFWANLKTYNKISRSRAFSFTWETTSKDRSSLKLTTSCWREMNCTGATTTKTTTLGLAPISCPDNRAEAACLDDGEFLRAVSPWVENDFRKIWMWENVIVYFLCYLFFIRPIYFYAIFLLLFGFMLQTLLIL